MTLLEVDLDTFQLFLKGGITYEQLHAQRCERCGAGWPKDYWRRGSDNMCCNYVYAAVADEGFFGELIRALSERLARLVGTGDVGAI